MANSVSVNTTNKDLWAGGAEPYKASYGKLMMWFFLISDAIPTKPSWFFFNGITAAFMGDRCGFKARTVLLLPSPRSSI